MRDTRREILDTAKRLFNERGYNDVSTRDISAALGISKGNLTYHFKRKEEIIEAILAENPQTRMNEAPATLEQLNIFFEDIEKTVRENAFYFWHHAQLAQLSPAIQKMQADTFGENRALLAESFRALKSKGLLRDEGYPDEYARLADTLLLAGIYWMPFCKMKDASGENFAEQAWCIVYPHLTGAGAKQLRKMGFSAFPA